MSSATVSVCVCMYLLYGYAFFYASYTPRIYNLHYEDDLSELSL